MTKHFRDSVSFAVMSVLIFIFVSLFKSEINESEDDVDTYWILHWIDLHRHFDIHRNCGIYSFEHIHIGILTALIVTSFCLTWILSKVLRHKAK